MGPGDAFAQVLTACVAARAGLLDEGHLGAVALFNGVLEGGPQITIDLCGKTLVIHDFAKSAADGEALARAVTAQLCAALPWISCVVWKARKSEDLRLRNGTFLLGGPRELVRKVREAGVWYAVAPTQNLDVGFYTDTRLLRAWARANLAGKRVLNTFAYTGALGVAARAAGAEVLHTDLSRTSLTRAKDSYGLNGWPIAKADFVTGDFFEVVGLLKRTRRLFDCVFLDPPFFSVTQKGTVDQQANALSLINRVRPLIAHGGVLACVNNAAFLSGSAHQATLDALCTDDCITFEQRVPVPDDCTGYPSTRVGVPAVDPAPYNHSTKISLLRVTRKDRAR